MNDPSANNEHRVFIQRRLVQGGLVLLLALIAVQMLDLASGWSHIAFKVHLLQLDQRRHVQLLFNIGIEAIFEELILDVTIPLGVRPGHPKGEIRRQLWFVTRMLGIIYRLSLVVTNVG